MTFVCTTSLKFIEFFIIFLQEEMERELENFEDEEELVNVDGTKVKLSGKVLKVN